MAETLEAFPPRPTKGSKYAQWLDGQIWRINWREEMDNSSVVNARSSLYFAATQIGLRLRTTVDGDDHVIIQSYKVNEVEVDQEGLPRP